MGTPSPAISTRALTKQYGSTTAVDGLSLSVPEGVTYGFLGPNGAGKTTTMRMLTGLVEPTDGDGFVAGTHCSERRQLVEKIGLLPEEPPLYSELTGREQLQFAADLRGVPWERVSDRALGLARELDLDGDLDRRIDGYSKGMRQKTAFVQAVQHDPDVVFLDEPTSGLDPRAARTLRELIVELTDDGTTVFLSTHILSVVEEIADRVGVLYDGQLVSEGSPAELTDDVDSDGDADLEEAFLELTDEPAAAW
ncbi:ABC transporter ATP-binding protein [Halapricum hydrolyticum]|uniref:ABC transporter ATP-binding protein n=1 Tax=Halapricum hydrolyticum TaxID=2979991 RepID=A0AAE3ICJ7_9EURY|nr:ABC transporter ATP-binding protein [Halapricum hydrolyticum]MCU4717182.1 ABC transporter ATP-binding protein [Halapricum hydrolyticum]MCU4726109.1 ABC transporter ATP-binding protein [Halapricum hydrolyticum]